MIHSFFLWPEQNQLLEVIISRTPSAASFANLQEFFGSAVLHRVRHPVNCRFKSQRLALDGSRVLELFCDQEHSGNPVFIQFVEVMQTA